MKTIIIPTADIVREHKTYDHMFGFLNGGIKDIVLAAARSASYSARQRNYDDFADQSMAASFHGNPKNPFAYTSALTQGMIRNYFDFVSQGLGINDILSHEHSVNVGTIEIVTQAIEEAVVELIIGLVGNGSMDVKPARMPWIGNDLIIRLEVNPVYMNRFHE